MPTPVVHQLIGSEVYSKLPAELRSQDMQVFYATNRPASGEPDARGYTNGITDKLQLGISTVRLGKPGLLWRELEKISTRSKRKEEVRLTLEATREIDSLPETDGKRFASEINRALEECRRPSITIYVHGAKSTFLRSTVQGAQFHHFMTRDTALVAYSWPSTGKFITYNKDVEYAAQSAANLADLIEFLAANTNASSIHLLAYSAGGQVVAPALALLRERHPKAPDEALREKLRLGSVYFAAADVGLHSFVSDYLPAFAGFVANITVTFHEKDSVLKIAQRSHSGESRLGRPDRTVLTESDIERLEGLAREHKFDAIDMQYSPVERPVNFKAHGHWYLNSWVSSDAILQFLFNEHPGARGLVKKPGTETWYFPPDYPERIESIVEERRAEETHR